MQSGFSFQPLDFGDELIHLSFLSNAKLAGVLELLAEEAEAFQVEERELNLQALRSCLESFSPAHQELLLAPYFGEGRVSTLAEQAGKSANSLYKLLARLREKLHACIQSRLRAEAP